MPRPPADAELPIGLALIFVLVTLLAFGCGVAADRAVAHPTTLTVKHKCQTVSGCRAQITTARKAIRWQKHQRVTAEQRAFTRATRIHRARVGTVSHAILIASIATGVPISELRAVAFCESRFDPNAKNRSSTASGLFQFLTSTFAHTKSAAAGLSIFDPYANALAAAQVRLHDGSWRQWVCGV